MEREGVVFAHVITFEQKTPEVTMGWTLALFVNHASDVIYRPSRSNRQPKRCSTSGRL